MLRFGSKPAEANGAQHAATSVQRIAISDQQKRRELALLRQEQNRRDSQNHARFLASAVLSQQPQPIAAIDEQEQSEPEPQQFEPEPQQFDPEADYQDFNYKDLNVLQASKLKGSKARHWFSRQLMLPEWMVDVPPCLNQDWYVFARPAGKRCIVVSSNGTTVSRLRNGSVLHHFPSSLPNGARTKENSGPSHLFCILDCIFNEADGIMDGDLQPHQIYYVIDMVCWRGYSLYDCNTEFRFFWLSSKLTETGACDSPSFYHKYRFDLVPVYNCDQMGMQAAYKGPTPYVKDGLLFYNKHAHYQTGSTPLALVWKDENCSEYVLDTDSKGEVPSQQHVVLELQEDGKVSTSDDPPIVFGILDADFLQKTGLPLHSLLRFAIGDGGLRIVNGKLEMADIHYVGKANRARAFADSYSKVLFQYTARRSPLRIEDLVASVHPSHDQSTESEEIEMVG